MSWVLYIDLLGTMVFAISGVLTAIHKKFDLVGTLVIGFVTAVGGGTIRDILIGRTPVGWMNDMNYIYIIFIGYILAYAFKDTILKLKKSMFLFDTIGIGLFTVIGIKVGFSYGLNTAVCLILGVVSACFGGVLRDVLTNEIPLIFRGQIYASACLIGGVCYLLISKFSSSENISIIVSIAIVILIRYFSVKHNWTLNFDRNSGSADS